MTSSNASPSGPKKPRSPWVWVGLGCGTAALLTFGGCAALLSLVGQRAAQEMKKPLNQKEVLAKLGDIPIYQPSTFNESMTKGARFGSSLFPGSMMSAAAFDTSDSPNQIVDWYEQQLSAKGYKRMPEQPNLNSKLKQVQFQKQSESIIVQVQETSASGPQKSYTLLLMRMKFPGAKASS
jgi:predicted ATP-binding protein involved in virulence